MPWFGWTLALTATQMSQSLRCLFVFLMCVLGVATLKLWNSLCKEYIYFLIFLFANHVYADLPKISQSEPSEVKILQKVQILTHLTFLSKTNVANVENTEFWKSSTAVVNTNDIYSVTVNLGMRLDEYNYIEYWLELSSVRAQTITIWPSCTWLSGLCSHITSARHCAVTRQD